MPVFRGGLWIFSLLFTSLLLWRQLSASTSSPTLPAPELVIYSRSEDSVALVCRAPGGLHGILFMLFQFTEKVDSQELPSGAEEVQFTVRVKEMDSDLELFCCLYKNQEGRYSAFSPYLKLEHHTDAPPTPSVFPPPVLLVQPSAVVVKRGDKLSFVCSLPSPLSQSQSQSGHSTKPLTFLLQRTPEGTGATSIIRKPLASQVSNPESQLGVFTVGPVTGDEGGGYTCLYQITNERGVVNSTVSNTVLITITDALPVPTLVLQQQTEVWHLLCTGSAAYPGTVFYLYLADNELPVATQHSALHEATFSVPVQDTSVALYRCQYKFLSGSKWSNSELSLPLTVIKEIPPQSTTDGSGTDWPLILGSFSALVLFLFSAIFVAVVAQRKVRAAVEEKKKRREAKFWNQVHAKDHVLELTLRPSSVSTEEWASVDSTVDTPSRSSIWNSLSTFTTPIHPVH